MNHANDATPIRKIVSPRSRSQRRFSISGCCKIERRVIADAIARHDGNWAAAARALGMHRSNLHHLATRLGLRERPRRRPAWLDTPAQFGVNISTMVTSTVKRAAQQAAEDEATAVLTRLSSYPACPVRRQFAWLRHHAGRRAVHRR